MRAWAVVFLFGVIGCSILAADENLLLVANDEEGAEYASLSDSLGAIEEGDLDNQGLFLIEVQEDEALLAPWLPEGVADEGISSFLESRATSESEELDNVFAYEVTTNPRAPSLENVTKTKKKEGDLAFKRGPKKAPQPRTFIIK